MIRGIGTDILELERVEKIGIERLSRRVLTEREREKMPSLLSLSRQREYVAGRFAAKEAVAKALGTGIGEKLSFQDVEILSNDHGAPFVQFLKEEYMERDFSIHLSISHCQAYVVAMVILEEQ